MSEKYTSLGLMSGTSGDGVDASVIISNGIDQFKVIRNKFYEYDSSIFNNIHNLKDKISSEECEKIIQIFELDKNSKKVRFPRKAHVKFKSFIVDEIRQFSVTPTQ